MTKKVIIKMRKDNKGIFLFIKTPKELENFFNKLSAGEKQISVSWVDENNKGIEFWKLTENYVDKIKENIKFQEYDVRTFNDFGDGLVNYPLVNIAPLRVVGISNGVKLYSVGRDLISNGEIDFYIKGLAGAIKEVWSKYIAKKEIKAIIELEI